MPLDAARTEALLLRIRQEVDRGILPACQLAVGLDGEIVLDEVVGDATVDTRFVIFSETKALIAATVWQLMADGRSAPPTPWPRTSTSSPPTTRATSRSSR